MFHVLWIFFGAGLRFLSTYALKFLILLAIYYLIKELGSLLSSLIPAWFNQIDGSLGSLPDSVLYILGVGGFDVGFPLLVAAAITRFMIRRIPLIG